MPWREERLDPRLRRWPIVVMVAGLAVTAAGVAATHQMYRHSEQQLLEQQTREVGAVLTGSIVRAETVVADAALLADATAGDPVRFATFADQMAMDHNFVGAQLVHTDGDVVASGGEGPLVGPTERRDLTGALLRSALEEPGTIRVALVEGDTARRIAYATTSATDTPFVVYAEAPLPDTPTGLGRSDGPFSDLDYAIYLGEERDRELLLFASTDEVPITGRTSTVVLPYADQGITFTARAARPLAGRFAQISPFVLAVGGIVVAAGAALGTRSVLRRGRAAERLARALAEVTREQRNGIGTLRQSLLPRRLQAPPGITLETGYWPADTDHEISGDFYDAFQVTENRWAVVIGDVCGKGVEAAALTGLARHTMRAAARHLRSPAEVLRWTHEAIAAYGAATYVTACFAFLDVADDGYHLSMSLGGHPKPALWRNGSVRLIGENGTLLGMVEPRLTTTVEHLAPGDVLVLYTDGLTDTPDALLDEQALAVLITTTIARCEPAACADAIRDEIHQLQLHGSIDDSAVLVVHVGDRAPMPIAAAAGAGRVGDDHLR